ncbi:MAG: SIS domain-containing protein [Spirochaetia bacterium]|jgi:6-phospho-3-hexuloisomerase
MGAIHEKWQLILNELHTALNAVDEEQAERLVDAVLAAEKVFTIGVGRVFLSLQAFVKRLNHLGIPSWHVGAINEPAITPRDLLIVASGSGESAIPVAIARIARQHGAHIAHIGSNAGSSLAPLSEVFVRIPVKTKLARPDEIPSAQIMSSLFEQCVLLLLDGIALRIAERKHLAIGSFRAFHANLE